MLTAMSGPRQCGLRRGERIALTEPERSGQSGSFTSNGSRPSPMGSRVCVAFLSLMLSSCAAHRLVEVDLRTDFSEDAKPEITTSPGTTRSAIQSSAASRSAPSITTRSIHDSAGVRIQEFATRVTATP